MKELIFYSALVLSVASCTTNGVPNANEETRLPVVESNVVELDEKQKKNAGVVTDSAVLKEMHTIVKAAGVAEVPPKSLISVSFPLGGYLKSASLLPGTPVSKGQVIATMEDQGYVQLQQDYLTAKAKMEFLSADMLRQKELSEADASSKKSFQLVLSEYKMQEILIQALREKLRMIHINPDQLTVNSISRTVPVIAPISGYVSKVNANIGKYVNPSDVLFELVNPDGIHAAITVFEKDISAFKKGLRGRVSLVDQPGLWHEIEVSLITRSLSADRTGVLNCSFNKSGHNLFPGMFLNAEFQLNGQQFPVISEDAVVRYMGKEYVFITADETAFQLVDVSTGSRENGLVALLPGKTDWQKTRIVVRGAYALLGKLKNKMED